MKCLALRFKKMNVEVLRVLHSKREDLRNAIRRMSRGSQITAGQTKGENEGTKKMQRLERREKSRGARSLTGALRSSTSASANLLFRPKGFHYEPNNHRVWLQLAPVWFSLVQSSFKSRSPIFFPKGPVFGLEWFIQTLNYSPLCLL